MAIAGINTAGSRTATKKCQVRRPTHRTLADLETRGLLDGTLLVWMGEFGRTPFAQGNNGRDRQPLRLQPLDGRAA